MRADLQVLGGGPGGAACALEAARLGLRVALFDSADVGADKPCGEGVMPSGVRALRDLGLARAVDAGRPFAGLRHVVPGARPLEIALDEPGVAIPRPALSRALSAALDSAGVSLGRADATVTAVATGAGANGRPGAGSVRRPAGRFGIRARFFERDPGTGGEIVEVHMGRGCEIYLTPLPGARVNAAILFDRMPPGVRTVGGLLEWALANHPAAARRLGDLLTPPAARALDAPRPSRVAGDRTFRVGDAGGAVDPILGCGVTIALRTGMFAARAAKAIVDGSDPRSVGARYEAAFRRETRSRRALAALLRHGSAHPLFAAAFVGILRRTPTLARTLAGVAAGTSRRQRSWRSDAPDSGAATWSPARSTSRSGEPSSRTRSECQPWASETSA